MSFWTWLKGGSAVGVTPNDTVESPASVGPDYNPGDPDGFSFDNPETFSRALPIPRPSPFSGWPSEWATPDWQSGISRLVDTAWDCIDLNSSVLSTMPVYRLVGGQTMSALSWMQNPDPDIYSSWQEFAKQVFWDYHLGEVFILATERYANGYPSRMRVMPPWVVKSELDSRGGRRHWIGRVEVTDDILHIRYKSSTDQPRGIGPLDGAGARLTVAGVLQRTIEDVARNGSVPPYILEVARRLNKDEATDLLDQWLDSRTRAAGAPAIVSGGTKAQAMQQPSPKDMALLELSQFTESRIAVKLGVPPFLMGLPSGGDSMTYSNVSSLFDYHDRASLKTKAAAVMQALSWWALPRGQAVELNRDEYTRPAFLERTQGYVNLSGMGAVSTEEIRTMERLHGDVAASALTGGNEGE